MEFAEQYLRKYTVVYFKYICRWFIFLIIHERVDSILIKLYQEISISHFGQCDTGKKKDAERMWTVHLFWAISFYVKDKREKMIE